MADEIKVTVMKFADRESYTLRYICPMTGKRKFKSADTSEQRAAQKLMSF
ncbi:MAG TPA: hypothetical protein VGN12_13950 [Pirellulales bacterium]|jgi:hypothetical protein